MARALEPGPTAVGVTGAFQDPTLDFNRGSKMIAANDTWQSNDEIDRGHRVPPTNDKEAAILVTHYAGNYSLVIRGKNNTIGIARLKMDQLP